MKKKNPAAVALGSRRWLKVAAQDQHAIRSSGGKAASAKLSAAERKSRAKLAGIASGKARRKRIPKILSQDGK